jgi:hypothetical protein
MITCTATLFFQNREAQAEMPQEAAAQTGCTNRPPILMSLTQNKAGSKRCSEHCFFPQNRVCFLQARFVWKTFPV